MKHSARWVPWVAVVCLTAAACGTEKSSNPVGPSGSGSTGGVTLAAPSPLEPANGAEVMTGQPLRLLLANSSSAGSKTLWYQIEIALDAEFASRVASADNIQPGGDGRSSYTLTQSLNPNRYYYWRTRATDGTNISPFSSPANFRLVDSITLEAPAPISPVNGETIGTTTPTMVARNTAVTGDVGAITYRFEVSANAAFTQVVGVYTAPRGGGETTTVTGSALTAGTEYFWRVQASGGDSGSPFSIPQSFRTPGGAPGGGGGGGGTPNPGGAGGPWPSTGEAVIAWAKQNYPDRLLPVASESIRLSNVDFLRDRMIEAGLCGGMQLGWNLKRGGPDISRDFFVAKVGGQWHGIDFARDAENNSVKLDLAWSDTGPDNGVFYTPYTGRLPCQ